MTDTRRIGDTRPYKRDPSDRLSWSLSCGKPFRFLPRHGEPLCVYEWGFQKLVKAVAWLPIYTAIIVTLVLLVQIFGIPSCG
jgi:hypothetical protein